jgi:hypothetical protein
MTGSSEGFESKRMNVSRGPSRDRRTARLARGTVMDRYLIVTPHTQSECMGLLSQVLAMGYLHNFDWGCEDGEHIGWAIIEAQSRDQAKLAVPPLVRRKAKVIRLTKFKDEDVKSTHSSA